MHVALFAWTSVERHILVYHEPWVATKKQRFLIHYLQPCLIILSCLTYYMGTIMFSACTNLIDYSEPGCMIVCYFNIPSASLFEMIVYQILPISNYRFLQCRSCCPVPLAKTKKDDNPIIMHLASLSHL